MQLFSPNVSAVNVVDRTVLFHVPIFIDKQQQLVLLYLSLFSTQLFNGVLILIFLLSFSFSVSL